MTQRERHSNAHPNPNPHSNSNPLLNVTKPYDEFDRAALRLGFMRSEADGGKVVQLTFSAPNQGGHIVYRIPFIADDSERITLLVHRSGFSGEWHGCEGIPKTIREEAHRKLCELVGVPYEPRVEDGTEACDKAAEGEERESSAQLATVNGIMAQDEHDLIRLGKEMKAMKTNSELEQDGMIPDPIQH